MSFSVIKTNLRSRLHENILFLNYLSRLEPIEPREVVPVEVNVMKGLFYVHLYSSCESTINELITHTITLIKTKRIQSKHYNHGFYTVALFDKLQSFKASGKKNFFMKASEIFLATNSNEKANLNESLFASNLQNVWFKTIEEVSFCLGVQNLTSSARVKITIDEIVEKRNAVAHGRENAATVGSRYRCDEIRQKFNETSEFLYELIDLYEVYFREKDFLKSNTKELYT